MRVAFWMLAVLALVVVGLLGIALGAVPRSLGTVWHALVGRGDPTAVAIVHALRLPRVALAALAGAGLAMSGAALQGALRNALAEPYLLGVSGGAAVGAVLAAAFGFGSPAALPVAALAGAIAAVLLVLGVAAASGG